ALNVASLFDIQSDADFAYGGGAVSNLNILGGGTLQKSVATGQTVIGGFAVNNSDPTIPPTVPKPEVPGPTRTLSLQSGGTSTGKFNVSADGVLEFQAGIHTANAGASFSGAGTVRVTGATLTVNAGTAYNAGATEISSGAANFNGTSTTGALTLSGGTLGGTGTLTVSGASTWTGGNMTGTGELITDGLLTITANDQLLSQHKLTVNQGAILNGAKTIQGGSGAACNVTIMCDVHSDADVDYAGGAVSVLNTLGGGPLQKSVATGQTVIGGFAVNNADPTIPPTVPKPEVLVQTGTLSLQSGG